MRELLAKSLRIAAHLLLLCYLYDWVLTWNWPYVLVSLRYSALLLVGTIAWGAAAFVAFVALGDLTQDSELRTFIQVMIMLVIGILYVVSALVTSIKFWEDFNAKGVQ